MRTFFILITLSLSLFSCNKTQRGIDSNRNEAAAGSNTDKFNNEKRRDAEFVYDVVETNYNEIKLAELGNQKSRTPAIKNMAVMLQDDHTSSLNDLKVLAQAKAISLPVEEPEDARRKIEDLAEESGKDFDEEWCIAMMELHDESIKKFERRLEDTEDADLQAFINKTLPVLRSHYESLKAFKEGEKK